MCLAPSHLPDATAACSNYICSQLIHYQYKPNLCMVASGIFKPRCCTSVPVAHPTRKMAARQSSAAPWPESKVQSPLGSTLYCYCYECLAVLPSLLQCSSVLGNTADFKLVYKELSHTASGRASQELLVWSRSVHPAPCLSAPAEFHTNPVT